MLRLQKIDGIFIITHRTLGLHYRYSFIGITQAKVAARKLQIGMEKGTEPKDLKNNFVPFTSNCVLVDANFHRILES